MVQEDDRLTEVKIRKAEPDDYDAIWQIIEQVISKGDTYVFWPDSSREEMLEYWCGADKYTYVATMGREIVGTFFIKDNMPGLGSHVANASYMTKPDILGKGIGRLMGEFSLLEARQLGYLAMQFNIVVKSNERAIRLWQSLGFEIKGEIPDAFKHLKDGFMNVYIMWRKL